MQGENLVMVVDDDGCFTERVIDFIGQYVKEDKSKLIKSGSFTHAYPFCWRSDTPLTNRAVPADCSNRFLLHRMNNAFPEMPFFGLEPCWIGQPDPDHEKACTIRDKEIKEHGEKEKDTSEDTEQIEHDQEDKYCDMTYHFSQNEPPCTLEDSVAELFHQDVHGQMLCLRKKVKERLRNSDDYQSFLKCIAQRVLLGHNCNQG
ncbi:unnamed protein product [Lactuca saligna]|uniref:Uncharacterized protein n=1 Tax=Lactuca saligna TaxID=75948 RepID=A0AA35Z2U3_LACSI|nr:unnamed protein product [Lactuca saligna]